MWLSRDSTEAAEHSRMAEDLGDFTSLAPSPIEIFAAVAVAFIAVALLVIWGPDAIEAMWRAIAQASR